MMIEIVKKIMADYYSELENALKTSTIDFSKLHLDDNVQVIGMGKEAFKGRKEVEEKREQFIAMMSHFEIIKQLFDDECACTILNWVVKSPHTIVATCELMTIKNGKIFEVRPIYGSLLWKDVMLAQGFGK